MSVEIPLIQEIQKRPCLYNFNMPEYNRKDILDSAWVDVAASVNLTVNECKDKWKNMRSSFVRSLKTVAGGKPKKPYYLYKYLQFVLPYLKPVAMADDSHATGAEINEDSSEMPVMIKIEPEQPEYDCEDNISFDPLSNAMKETDIQPNNGRQLRRRMRQKNLAVYQRNRNRRLQQFVTPKTENNAMRYFLLSLLPELDTLDENQVRLFKIKVMMLIDDIKTDTETAKQDLPNSRENFRIQKRLINLLLKNLEKKL